MPPEIFRRGIFEIHNVAAFRAQRYSWVSQIPLCSRSRGNGSVTLPETPIF